MTLLPHYVVHAIEGRARLRHPALGTDEGRNAALELLLARDEVRDIEQGRESLLLLLKPEADPVALLALCAALEARIPALKKPAASSCSLGRLTGLPPRKLENRALFAALGVSAALGVMGSERAHVFTAAAFGALVAHHVWTRRGAL